MKYFVGCLVTGEFSLWHKHLKEEISRRFAIPLSESPSHITLYRPFETEDVGPINNVIADIRNSIVAPGEFITSGVGYFDNTVIFVSINASPQILNAVLGLKQRLARLPGMPSEDFPIWRPHITLGNHLPFKEFNLIWNYVSKLRIPDFSIAFDNVTLFRKNGEDKSVPQDIFLIKTHK